MNDRETGRSQVCGFGCIMQVVLQHMFPTRRLFPSRYRDESRFLKHMQCSVLGIVILQKDREYKHAMSIHLRRAEILAREIDCR